MPVTSIQFGQYPWKYTNGLKLSNNATTPNTKLDVAIGNCLDSTGVFQMTLSTALTINAATTGFNALDTGTLAASTVYKVFLIGDPVSLQATGCVLSTSTTPTLPTGYSVYTVIGYVTTDSSAHFLLGYWTAGEGNSRRLFMYDAPQATAVTAGASTTYANVDLTKWVPLPSGSRPVWIATNFSANAAADTLKMQPGNATGDAITITAPVVAGTAHVTSNSMLLAQPVTISSVSSPVINYKVSSGTDAVAINVAGYEWFI